MPRQKVLSAKQVLAIFRHFGFSPVTQKGSHIKLERINSAGTSEIVIVPNHSQLDRGMARKIYKDARKYLSDEELRPHFYTS